MGRDRKLDRKPVTRKKKNATDKRRRQRAHRTRLIALGMPADAVKAMNPKQVRTLLKRPLRTRAMLAQRPPA